MLSMTGVADEDSYAYGNTFRATQPRSSRRERIAITAEV